MTDKKHCPCCCSHQWTQTAPFTPAWAIETPSTPVCTRKNQTVTPNPIFPSTATLPICTPLELKKTGPSTILISVSIPAEAIITLPTKALEIKMIRKSLKITQWRFFNSVPSEPGLPHDTPKLFIGGFVRKDIQYSEVNRRTATAVEGIIKDFVVDIPISCVVDLGKHFVFPPVHFNQQREYGFSRSIQCPSSYPSKGKMPSGDLTEFNVVSQEYHNPLPFCELVFSQINEMDSALDCMPSHCEPFEEGVFNTLQEKMIVLIQIRLTFQPNTDHDHDHDPHDKHPKTKKC
ncbi:conserved hypothetical protein [Candidatus Desulfosporosinus infrequens]|uniref:SipL SPOCS domain-containing protein n=1 Tax=Candidatus Desulfosporosinus infrequens TaxID=2043169 RepID=A0A2U3L1P9_9FIRM|nr:conserved hypothetical protein [Candidatus Desulfosporosinus infrequens]